MKLDTAITVTAVHVHPIAVPLVRVFKTSFGDQALRGGALVRVETLEGVQGWGECVANWTPAYSAETTHTALHVLRDFLIPSLVAQPHISLDAATWTWLDGVRGHPMAKHALMSALFSALAAQAGASLADLVLSLSTATERRQRVEVGVSEGIQPTIDATLAVIQDHVEAGYGRVKLKIKPNWDVELVRAVRGAFPNLQLMADANSAYTLDDLPTLQALDAFGLMMIEQPLAYHDIYEHSLLQAQLDTPICLDESLKTLGDVKLMHHLGAGKIVNLKPQRVGGLWQAVAIHDFCQAEGIPLWIGGMLETGVGRAMSLAVASLPGVTLPSDLSATQRYYDPDIADPPFDIDPADSTMNVPDEIGLGVQVVPARLAEAEAAYRGAMGLAP